MCTYSFLYILAHRPKVNIRCLLQDQSGFKVFAYLFFFQRVECLGYKYAQLLKYMQLLAVNWEYNLIYLQHILFYSLKHDLQLIIFSFYFLYFIYFVFNLLFFFKTLQMKSEVDNFKILFFLLDIQIVTLVESQCKLITFSFYH